MKNYYFKLSGNDIYVTQERLSFDSDGFSGASKGHYQGVMTIGKEKVENFRFNKQHLIATWVEVVNT